MLDKNGKEIKVGDIVSFCNAVIGKVTEVGHNYYVCNNWTDGYGDGGRMETSSYVEIIKSAEPPSLSQLKAQAKLEIEALIKKHTTIINQAGGNLEMHIGFHNVRPIGSEQPSQLIDVVVTVTI